MCAVGGYALGRYTTSASLHKEIYEKADRLLRHSAHIMRDMRALLSYEADPGNSPQRSCEEIGELKRLISDLDYWYFRRFGKYID